jgi:hypothetical protein
MLNLLTAFENFAPDIEVKEPSIDSDFITDFLLPYYRDLPREALAAKVAEIIAVEKSRRQTARRPR